MKVAIYSRGLSIEQESPLLLLLEALAKFDTQIFVYQNLLQQFQLPHHINDHLLTFSNSNELDESIDCLISLGGDGTLLDTVSLVKNKRIPILGINFGRLGFLASISKEEMLSAVESLVNRTYHVDKRSLIHLDSDQPIFGDTPFALNEFAIHKRDISPMVKIHTYINGEFLNSYWADGIIVTTPTGSTGYNLSCNGPIIFPDAASFVITPVAPHNLNVRPIVVPDHHVISFEVESRAAQVICALDARREIIDKTIQLAVKKEDFSLNLIRLNENSFLSTLRTKLSWGLDKRN